MNKELNTKEVFVVPLDVLLDVVQIILSNNLKYAIEDMKRAKNAIVLELEFEPRHDKAQQNIQEILDDYNYYRYGEEQS